MYQMTLVIWMLQKTHIVYEALGLKNVKNPITCGYLKMYKGDEDKITLPVQIDSRFLIGPEGAHLNISGISGLAAKTSYSMFLLKAIQDKCLNSQEQDQDDDVVFVLFNLKGKDLLALDEPNEYESADIEEHFFEVIMEDVIFESDDLLDEEQVIKYLQAIAPVPYVNYFIFSSKIQEIAKKNKFKIDEYAISVNGNQLFKPYKTKLYEGTADNKKTYDEISDVEFKIFKNNNGKPIAWMLIIV